MESAPTDESTRALGAAIRQQRMAKGMSLRALAKQVGLAAHGTLVDYEHGRRIAPEDLVIACEKVLDITDGRLRRLRSAALLARAERHARMPQGTASCDTGSATHAPVVADPALAGAPIGRGNRFVPLGPPRLVVLAAVAVVLAAAAVTFLVWPDRGTVARPRSSPQLRFGFETNADRWGILWGRRKAHAEITDTMHYEGSHCLQVTITGASATAGYVAFGTTHGLQTLRSGMRVTMRLWTSYPKDGVRFFVYDSKDAVHWAPETPHDGSEVPLTGGSEWSAVTWTVPTVDVVQAIGVQPYAENDDPRIVAIDAVSW